MNSRIMSIRYGLILIILGIILRLFHLQIIEGSKFLKASEENRIKIIPQLSSRGIIFDRNGRILANNRAKYVAFMFPRPIKSQDARTIKRLSRILKIKPEEIIDKLNKNEAPYRPVKIKEDLDLKMITRIREDLYLSSVLINTIPVRHYPQHKLASHIIGYVGEISKELLQTLKDKGYKTGDIVGLDGIERSYDRYLKGEEGGSQVEVDAQGVRISTLGFKSPVPGDNLILTIDSSLQQAVEDALGDKVGAVVVMNPLNFEVLAMVSKPNFDVNFFLRKITPLEWRNVLNHPHDPLQNRAIANKYPPGSIFKIVTAAAALENKIVKEESNFFCSGKYLVGNRKFRCWKRSGHGKINFIEAISNSCDVAFYILGEKIGIENLERFAHYFGIGEYTGIDLPGEVAGTLPNPQWKKRRPNLREPWYLGDTLNMSIGQGFLQMTPLQAVKMVSIIANGGYTGTPHIVKEIISYKGKRKLIHHQLKKVPLSTNTIEVIKCGMKEAVDKGTAVLTKIPGLEICGKTGTAEDPPRKKPHAWFVGFAPYDKPKIAICVFVEQGGSGGKVAAPIAKEIILAAQKLGYFK